MKFIVDSNVEKVGRWLRAAGFDTAFAKDIDDNRLVRVALDEGRVLITRDTQILRRRVVVTGKLKVVFIEQDGLESQLKQLFERLDLSQGMKPFSRCIECNVLLVPRAKEEIEGKVPPYVYQTQTQYMQCPDCERVYWRGTHWERMRQELEAITGADL